MQIKKNNSPYSLGDLERPIKALLTGILNILLRMKQRRVILL